MTRRYIDEHVFPGVPGAYKFDEEQDNQPCHGCHFMQDRGPKPPLKFTYKCVFPSKNPPCNGDIIVEVRSEYNNTEGPCMNRHVPKTYMAPEHLKAYELPALTRLERVPIIKAVGVDAQRWEVPSTPTNNGATQYELDIADYKPLREDFVAQLTESVREGLLGGIVLDDSADSVRYTFDQVREAQRAYEPPRTAASILRSAAELLEERGKQYDSPQGERSMPKAIAAFNAITGRALTTEEGWLLMGLVKDVRQYTSGKRHEDSALDGVAYAALEAEEILGTLNGKTGA